MENYTIYHLHSDLSVIDGGTKFDKYIDKAKELGMTAIGFSEHGSVFQWVKKKQYCDKVGIKYIHGEEFYVTESLEEKVRDNYHCILIARNWDGVRELNKLSSIAYNKQDGHRYYNPRITYDELINTSNNIIICTACIAGILFKCQTELKDRFIKFLAENKHRCFLEVQHHNVNEQKVYNIYLTKLAKQYQIPLICGTDTHTLDQLSYDARNILQKSKGISFSDEDEWDLTFKTYDELITAYKIQGVLSDEEINEAISSTNKIAEMVEFFEFDLSFKYPKLYENSDKIFKDKISSAYKKKGLTKKEGYKQRIKYEYESIAKNGAIDYLLLQEDIINFCHKNNIWQGYSRGSVSGSECAYLLGITDIDSIKWEMNFERFMNLERVSLSDIDIDYPPDKRDMVKDYIFNKEGLYCSDIITFNTIATKGAIRDVARALDISLEEVNDICNNIETDEDTYRIKYPELFKYVDLLNGMITSVGSHPCGVVVSPIPIDEYLGTFTTSTSEYPICQVDMKCVDSLNFVKLDILGLDNIQIINEVCELVGIERLTPDNTDFNDKNVWGSIMENSLGIFQWEGDYAHSIYKKLFSQETLSKIKSESKNITYLDLFSMGNGAIRPAGESYRDKMCRGEFNDNGHEALNKLLEPTLGYLVYQESVLEFLNKFCGFTMGQADNVRRGFAKKTGTEQYIPLIKSGFIKTMQEEYDVSKEKAESLIDSFLKVIEDASSYLFSLNHSLPYSMIGYVCAYLRYYYTGEFLTVMLNINKDNIDKTSKIIEYANNKDIKIDNIKFRNSKSDYSFDKVANTIYKGLGSIKFLNNIIADELYEFKDKLYNDFFELLCDIKNTSINSRQLEILVKLDFFSEFGKSKALINQIECFNNLYGRKQINKDQLSKIGIPLELIKKYAVQETDKTFKEINIDGLIRDICRNIKNEDYAIKEKTVFENDYLGYIKTLYHNMRPSCYFVTDIETKYSNPVVSLHCLCNGDSNRYKVKKTLYNKNPFKVNDIINVEFKEDAKWKMDGEHMSEENPKGWWQDYNDKEILLKGWTIIRE